MSDDTLRVDHLALPSFDAEATYRFYTDVMRFRLAEAETGDDWGGRPWLMMFFATGDGRQIVLTTLRGVERPDPGALPPDLLHVAFAAKSSRELAIWRRRLTEADIPYDEEDHGRQRSLYFSDPNGTVLEITAPASEVHASDEASNVISCWLTGRAGEL